MDEDERQSNPTTPATGGFRDIFSGMGSGARGLLGTIQPVDPLIDNEAARRALILDNIQDQFETIELDDSPQRTAEHTEAMANYTSQLLEAMRQSVKLNEETRQANQRTEIFTRRMTVASFIVSLASLGAAVASMILAASVHP